MNTKIKSIVRIYTISIAALLLITSSTWAQTDEKNKGDKKGMADQIIIGTVVEVSSNEEGEVQAVAIHDSTEIKGKDGKVEKVVIVHKVAQDEKGSAMLALVGKRVEVTGTITTDDDGTKTILVKKYKVIEPDVPKTTKK